MRVTIYLFGVLVLVLFQVGILPPLFGGYPHFNILLCLVIALAFGGYSSESLWTAFSGGLVGDFFVDRFFGLTSLLLVLFSYFCGWFYRVLGSKLWLSVVTSFVLSLFLRVVFSFFQFGWFCLGGALGDAFLVGVFLLILPSVWERIFGEQDRQLNFYDRL